MRFSRHGRAPRAIIAVALTYALILFALVVLDAAWWLMAFIALFTLPALWDIWKDPSAGLELTKSALVWYTGRREGRISFDEIDHMRFDTRFDFSVRVSAILKSGKRVRLPYESLPPHRALEAALKERGIDTIRHHFRIF